MTNNMTARWFRALMWFGLALIVLANVLSLIIDGHLVGFA